MALLVWLGWILLAILCFVLLSVLLILFFPVLYRLEAKKDAEGFEASLRVKWLFGFVRMLFDYPKPGHPIVKVAFFTVYGKERSEKKRRKKLRKKRSEEAADNAMAQEAGTESEESHFEVNGQEGNPADGIQAEAPQATEEKPSEEGSPEGYSPEGNSSEENLSEENTSDENTQEGNSSGEDDAEEATSDQNVDGSKEGKNGSAKANKMQQIREKFDKVVSEYRFYRDIWNDKDTRPFLKDALARVFHILKNLMPRRIRGRLLFGASSPDVTGYLFGIYCMLSTLFPKRVLLSVEPDFERAVFEAEVNIKGHFMLFTLLVDGLRILFDKRLKKLRKMLKRE